jgi:hypothetical protein
MQPWSDGEIQACLPMFEDSIQQSEGGTSVCADISNLQALLFIDKVNITEWSVANDQ